jgi:hypothetical protein
MCGVIDNGSAEFRALAAELMARTSPEADRIVGAPLDVRIADSLGLIDVGEPVIAFENLCQNLYEYEMPISADEYQRLAALGVQWGVAPDGWRFLADNVRA